MTVTMYDAITVGNIPANAEAVAGYTSGFWPTWLEVVARFPNAKHISIAIFADHDAHALDVETGDASPGDAPAWVRRQHARGLKLPILYANSSTMPSVIAALTNSGIKRDEYMTWEANYDNIPKILPGSDASQYWDKAFGRNLDVSLCKDTFFGNVSAPPKPSWVPRDEVNWLKEWTSIKNKPGLNYHLRRLFLKVRMTTRRKLIWTAAHTPKAGGWTRLNRLDRYNRLKAPTR